MYSNKEIALFLIVDAYQIPENSTGRYARQFDNMTVRCDNTLDAVRAMAAKFERPMVHKLFKQPKRGTTKRPPKIIKAILNSFEECGELDNIQSYIAMYRGDNNE